MSHKERRKKEKQEIKQSILDAARKIARKKGWHAVTIRKIADEIEYTPPIIYEYFENKEDLFRELSYIGFKILYEEYEKAIQGEHDPKKLLLQLSLTHWDYAQNYTDLYQLMFGLERPAPSAEMMKYFNITENIFLNISGNNKTLSEELLMNWVSMIYGAITIWRIMHSPLPDHFTKIDPKDIYISMIKRFISSI